MDNGLVESLADAVAEGEAIDWASVRSRLRASDEQALAAQLESLSGLSHSDLWRTHERAAHRARLALPLELGAALSVAFSLAGAIGLVVLSMRIGARALVLLAGLSAFGTAAAWLWWSAGSVLRARALSAAYWSVAVSFAFPGVAMLERLLPATPWVEALVSMRPEAFMAAFFWTFAREFPAVPRFSTLDRVARGFQIGATSLAAALIAANITAAFLSTDSDSALRRLTRDYAHGQWFWVAVFVITVPALGVIAARAQTAIASEKSRVRLFLLSLALAIGPLGLEVIAEAVIPSFGAFMRDPNVLFAASLVVYPALFAFPIVTTYVLLAHDVLDVRMRVHQALRYLLMRGVLGWLTTLPMIFLVMAFYLHRDESVAAILLRPEIRALAWFTAASVALLAFRQQLLNALDRWMTVTTESPALSLAHLGEALQQARTPLEVASALAQAASRAMQSDADIYTVQAGHMLRTEGRGLAPASDSLIPILAKGIGQPFVIDEGSSPSYYALLSQADREWIGAVGTTAVCPLSLGTADVADVLVMLNRRRSSRGFSPSDLQFLTAACGSAALAGQRLALHEAQGAPRDELALQCAKCRRVIAWRAGLTTCECGEKLSRAAVPAELAGRFRVDAVLGRGGMGVVYRGWDLRVHRDVALKTLPHLSGEAAANLQFEARSMGARLHPHIAVVYGVESWRNTPILVVEYLAGGTLADRLKSGPVAPVPAFAMVDQLAAALVQMHDRGQTHGDVKPSNIGLTDDGVVKFLDFGLSRTATGTNGDHAHRGGTPAYLPPEAFVAQSTPVADDVWALSVVLCELLSGAHPFLADHRLSRTGDGRSTMPTLRVEPAGLRARLAALLHPLPDRRPADARALALALHAMRPLI